MKYKNFTLLLLAAILSTNAFSQPTITKQKYIGGSKADFFSCMDLTNDGGLIVGGSSYSDISGQKTNSSKGKDDYWIVKLDSLQHIEWDRTIGGKAYEGLQAIMQTADSGYILGGSSNSDISGDKTENCIGTAEANDYWIVKLNKNGIIEWDKTIGGRGADYLVSIEETSDEGYIMGGYSDSDSSGKKTQNSKGYYDYWVVKVSGTGHVEWDKTIGGDLNDYFSALQQTADGGYILGGYSNSDKSGDKTQNPKLGASRYNFDYWIVKLNNAGNIEWDKTIGGRNFDELKSLQQTSDGGYILGGASISNSSGNKTENNKGSYDYWIVKLTGTGHIQWDKTIGGDRDDWLYSIQQTTDDGYILGGYSYSKISGDKTESRYGENDYWVVKIDKKGTVQWDKTIGSSYYDYLHSVKEVKKNNYVIGGYLSGAAYEGKSIINPAEIPDYSLVYLEYIDTANFISSPSKIGFQNPTAINKNFSTYPNPAQNILYVQSKTKAVFTLTDQSGKTILTKTIEGNGEINVAALVPGIYYLKNNDTGLSQKIIVSR